MKHLAYGAAVLTLVSLARPARAGHRSRETTDTRESRSIRGCADFKVQFGDFDSLTGESQMRLTASEAAGLEVSASPNGGIWVQGGEGPDVLVTLCKAVPADEKAKERLAKISLSRNGARMVVNGPEDGDWAAHLIIRAPRGSSIALDAENGPVSLREFSGTAKVESANGPVSLLGCRGTISVDSQNGPIRVSETSGRVSLEARNGPLSVRLPDGGWTDGSLDGKTENGPLNLELARGPSSGIRVESAGRSPFHCLAPACREARRNWDDDHKTIEFGTASPSVRLSTVNGPVSIDSIGLGD
ncbi:MAG: hypothetical protein ACRD16_06600 [Thermoanaerobaculia bacterium]